MIRLKEILYHHAKSNIRWKSIMRIFLILRCVFLRHEVTSYLNNISVFYKLVEAELFLQIDTPTSQSVRFEDGAILFATVEGRELQLVKLSLYKVINNYITLNSGNKCQIKYSVHRRAPDNESAPVQFT